MTTMCNYHDKYDTSLKIKRTYLIVKIDGVDQKVELKIKNMNPQRDGPHDSVWYLKSPQQKYYVFKDEDKT